MHYSPIERAAPQIDLFDVDPASVGENLNPKPRNATDKEIRAYMRWLCDRAGLGRDLSMELIAQYQRNQNWRVTGATFGRKDSGGQYEAGSFSIAMPGANQSATVTMETLDESGAVIASQSLPVEPKKCGIIWDKAAVHKAVGPVAKPAKGKRKAAIPAHSNEPPPAVEITDAPIFSPMEMQEAVEATIAHDAPEIAPSEPGSAPFAANDAMAALMARIDALEAAVADMATNAADSEESNVIALPAPWKGARQLAQMRADDAADRRQAERARRERIVRAYLRMRARRDLDARALEAGREYCGKLQERAEKAEQRERGLMMEGERLAFRVSELEVKLATETARADAAEAVALPAIDKAQRRIGELEQQIAQAAARGFTPKSRIAECFRATPRPVPNVQPTSNVIILSSR